jgi:hypothetical protein
MAEGDVFKVAKCCVVRHVRGRQGGWRQNVGMAANVPAFVVFKRSAEGQDCLHLYPVVDKERACERLAGLMQEFVAPERAVEELTPQVNALLEHGGDAESPPFMVFRYVVKRVVNGAIKEADLNVLSSLEVEPCGN